MNMPSPIGLPQGWQSMPVSFFQPCRLERRLNMAAKNNSNQRKHLKPRGSYSSGELQLLTMEDGTRVVCSADGDIKRPICAGVDVHKEILMAAVCKTDTETLRATFYVRKFTTRNNDIRSMALWLKGHGVEDACMESTGKYWIPVFNISGMPSTWPVCSAWIWSLPHTSRLLKSVTSGSCAVIGLSLPICGLPGRTASRIP